MPLEKLLAASQQILALRLWGTAPSTKTIMAIAEGLQSNQSLQNLELGSPALSDQSAKIDDEAAKQVHLPLDPWCPDRAVT